MSEDNVKLHVLLQRQLKRADINDTDLIPAKKVSWDDFLLRISRAYYGYEQDCYLLERSMRISSTEMMDLNEKLEYAQKIAHLGYWFYDRKENKATWSKETFHLMGIDPADGEPSFENAMEYVHKNDRKKLIHLIELAFSEGKDYEIELQIKNKKDNQYYWYLAKGHPHSDNQNSTETAPVIRYLSGIIIDITERKKSEENVKKIHQQLLSISRQAGMAEVATSILHNIGNILNSANVSISMLLDVVAKSHITKLVELASIIKEHINKDDYLTQDETGKLIPDYLAALSQSISKEYNHITDEIENINTHLNHIKEIVSMQKDISGISGVKEEIALCEIVDLAIQMSCASSETKDIEIIKNYNYQGTIRVEKAKLLQILVNLIRNAKDALMALPENITKQITIYIIKPNKESCVQITIKDNGVGIPTEFLTKIFSLGFTTKETGHGFGLHSSAIAATELNGELHAESGGENQGATFILTLPLAEKTCANTKKEKNDVLQDELS